MADTASAPACPYCGAAAVRRSSSAHLYRGHDYGPVWECRPCGAWVGCHPDGRPLGRLANLALRRAKQAAHAAFDPLWRAKQKRDGVKKCEARDAGYRWLAGQLGIPRAECHIGMFDEAMCARVVEVCRPYTTRGAATARRADASQCHGSVAGG